MLICYGVLTFSKGWARRNDQEDVVGLFWKRNNLSVKDE